MKIINNRFGHVASNVPLKNRAGHFEHSEIMGMLANCWMDNPCLIAALENDGICSLVQKACFIMS